MAKITSEARSEKMKAIWAEKKANNKPIISDTLPTSEVMKETKTEDNSMKLILERLERQEAELKQLKNLNKNVETDAKEVYKWPRNYAFSLRAGVPILSRTWYAKDSTKDLEYKNEFGQYVTNHYMLMKLQDGTEVETTNYLFNRDRKKTEPMPAKLSTDEFGNTTYIFYTDKYWKVTILSTSFIN